MTTQPLYEYLADAFVAEGMDTYFVLLGDGNMHWSTYLRQRGIGAIHSRHEHNAVTMAMGYSSATGKVGVASVTCGPGLTQIITALFSAVRGRVPVVIFSGETPLSAGWHNQSMPQQTLIQATGAHYISAHDLGRINDYVFDAFYTARTERRPVVLGVPYDLQQVQVEPVKFKLSEEFIPRTPPMEPNSEQLKEVAGLILKARSPVFIAGRGALQASAEKAIEELAETSGALLATTLPMRGLFDHNPFSLGIAGGFSSEVAFEVFREADLLVTFGAGLNNFTLHGGKLSPKAKIVRIDVTPRGIAGGIRLADMHMTADARIAAERLCAHVRQGKPMSAVRSEALMRDIRERPADSSRFEIAEGVVDPRDIVSELGRLLANDYDVVSGTGNQAYYHTVMRGMDPRRYHVMREFGAVGNGLGYVVGVAAARNTGKVVLFEGDGGLMMNIEELETIARHGLKLLIVCMNDGAYGAEIHRLRHDGLDASGAIFGRPPLAAVAEAFGLRGATITRPNMLAPIIREFEQGDTTMVLDVHVSDQVVAPSMMAHIHQQISLQ